MKYVLLALALSGSSLFAMERVQISTKALRPIKRVESTEKIPQPTQEINTLFTAIRNGDDSKVTQLLQYSKNPKALANSHDQMGLPALHAAAISGNVNTIKALVFKGADADTKNSYDITPLMVASSRGKPEAVDWLIILGSDVNAKDKGGLSALDYVPLAPKQEIQKTITELLKYVGAK